MVQTSESVDLATIERLAAKVTALVELLERTRRELNEAGEDNRQLRQELATLRQRTEALETDSHDAQALRGEREQLRTRIEAMLEQLEAIDL